MILDKIENLQRYDQRLQFIKETLQNKGYVKGKFDISEPLKFGIGIEYTTKNSEEGLWEAHRRYLDIHVILEGEELVEIADISNMISTKDYEDDYELFTGEKDFSVNVVPGDFLVLFPNEVHKTGVKIKDATAVKKIVFKLLLDERS